MAVLRFHQPDAPREQIERDAPNVVTAYAPGCVFPFFFAMMVLQLIWVKTIFIDTKGVPLERMQQRLGVA